MSPKTLSAFLVWLLASSCAQASLINNKLESRAAPAPLSNGNGNLNRQLMARRSSLNLEKRHEFPKNCFRTHHTLPFAEDVPSGRSPFMAHVEVRPKFPTLLLEDIESHIERISCGRSQLEISFTNAVVVENFLTELRSHPDAMLITSHNGCNAEGERRPFSIQEVEVQDRGVVLTLTPLSWKSSFHSIDVRFGSNHQENSGSWPGALKRRQASPSATNDDTKTDAVTSPTSSIAFPPPPSASPTGANVHGAQVNVSLQNTAILPPNFPGVDGATLHGPFVPHGMTISCKNCTMGGSVDLSQGMFSKSGSSSDSNSTEGIEDFYDDGYVEMTVNDFNAHIELESTVVASQSINYFTAPFPDITLPGFSIPGIAEIGPVFRPRVTFGIEIATGLDFTYGVDVTIPNNSTIQLNVKNASASTVTGFQQSSITALPFQSTIDSINLTASVAFNPQLLLTIAVLDNQGSISAGAFLDLPKVTAQVSQVTQVDDKCNPVNSSSAGGTAKGVEGFVFQSLTNIVPSLEIDAGVIADAHLRAGKFEIDDQAVYTAFSTSAALPTACLAYDTAAKTYGPASAALATATATGASKSKSKSAASPSAEIPTRTSSLLALAAALFFWGMFVA